MKFAKISNNKVNIQEISRNGQGTGEGVTRDQM